MVFLTRDQADALISAVTQTIESHMFTQTKYPSLQDLADYEHSLKEPIEMTLEIIAKNISDEVSYFKF